MLSLHLGHIDQRSVTIDRLDAEVAREMDPFVDQVSRLCTIPGIGQRTAEVVIAEIGVDMTRFPTAKHLASWAGLCPGHHESAVKKRSGTAAKVTQRCEWRSAMRHGRRPARRHLPRSPVPPVLPSHEQATRGQSDLAVALTMILIISHVLANNVDYDELGGDYFDRRDRTAETRRHVAGLQRLGHTVTLDTAA